MKSLSGLNKFFVSLLIINFILPSTFSAIADITDKKEEVNKVLNQEISIAGGTKVKKGKIEFFRFQNDRELDRRLISYNPNTKIGSLYKPILMDEDIIRIRNSALTTKIGVPTEVTRPILGIFAIQQIFDRGN